MLCGQYRIGQYTVDFDAKRIALGDRPVEVHWRGVQALRELAASPGEVVPRDKLFQALWPGAVVDESNLGKVISQLRRTLEESDPGTNYIETLPGAGYRLLAPVQSPQAKPPAVPVPAPQVRSYPWWRLAAGAGLLAAVAVAGTAWWLRPDPKVRAFDEALARGNDLLGSRDPARVTEAVGYLRRATELNPGSAPAFAALAHALNRLGGDVSGSLETRSPALQAAERSVALDPECAGCNGTLGLYLLSYGWEWERSRLHLEKAMRLDPANSSIRPSYALLLLVTGKRNEALEQIDIALGRSPFQPGYHTIRARTLYFLKRYPEAVEAADRAIGLQPNDAAGWEWKSQALMGMGHVERGIEAITARRYPQHAATATKAARQGGIRAALRVLIEASGDSWQHSWRRARWKAMLGDAEGAIGELELCRQKRHFESMFVAVEPVFEPLHQHSKFRTFVTSMGLDTSGPQSSPERRQSGASPVRPGREL